MTADIQRARDILAKWREAARLGEWSIEADTADSSWLGRGTAGNPALLDALDGLLDYALRKGSFDGWADTVAAAIIAADEAMSA